MTHLNEEDVVDWWDPDEDFGLGFLGRALWATCPRARPLLRDLLVDHIDRIINNGQDPTPVEGHQFELMFQLDMLKPGMNSTEPPHPENLKDCVEFLRTVLTFSQKEYVGIAEAERQVLIDFTLPSLINNNLIEKIYAIDPSMEDIVRKAME